MVRNSDLQMPAALSSLFVLLAVCALFFLSPAHAATYTFDDSGLLPLGCSRSSAGNYQCPSATLAFGDSLVINGTKPATITFSGNLTLDQVSINSGGNASDLNLLINGALDFTNTSAVLKGSVTAHSVCASNSNCAGHSFGRNLTVTAGNAILGAGATVGGTLSVTGNLSLDRLTLGQAGNSGTILTSTGTLTLTNSSSTFNGQVSVGGWSCAGSNCAQTVNGNLTVAAGGVTLGFGSVVSGLLTVKGSGAAVTLDRVTLGTAGNSGLVLDTTGTLSLSNSSAVFNGNVAAGGWSCTGSNCSQILNGSLTVTLGGITLGSGSVAKGTLTAKGTGGFVMLDRVTLGTSGNTGTIIDTVGSVTFSNTGATIHGNVIAASFAGQGSETVNGSLTTTAIPGAVFAASTTVTGCVSAATSTSPKAIQYGAGNTINATCCRMADNSCYATQDCVAGAASTPAYCAGATITYENIVVNASGSAAGGVYPIMELWVDGVKMGTVSITSTAARDYAFPAIYPTTINKIDVVFTNDAFIGTADRNLNVFKVTARGKTFLPTDPGVVYELPYSGYATPLQFLAGQSSIHSNGALRFSFTPLIVGNCYAGVTGYPTINAAIAAAAAGDIITICPGTYNESVNISKSITLRSRANPATAAVADVIVNGGSSPAVNLPNASTARRFSLSGLKLQSTGNALYANYVNNINTDVSLYRCELSSTGTTVEMGNGNPGQFNFDSSTATSSNGGGINIGANATGRVYLGNGRITASGTGVSHVGSYGSNLNQHIFQITTITTTGNGANAIDVRNGRLYLDDVFITAKGVGVYHDAGHSGSNFFRGVSINSVGDGIKSMANLLGPHTYDNIYIRTSGAGSRGMSVYAGTTYNDIDIVSDGDALYIDRTNGQLQTHTNLKLVSTSGYGLRVASSGTQISGAMHIGNASGSIDITAGLMGIYLGDSMSAGGTVNLNNINITAGGGGIKLDANMAGIVNVGTTAQVTISNTGSSNWGLQVAKANTVTVNKLNITSDGGGLWLDSNVSGTIKLQGTLANPIRLTSNSPSTSTALKMNNLLGAALIDQIILRAPNGNGLDSGSNASISSLKNFDIASAGVAVNIATQPVSLVISDGVATATRSGVNAINLATGGSCSTAKTISNVIATPGSGGRGIYVGCASTVNVSGSCTIGGEDGMYFDSNAGRVTLSGNSMGGYAGSGLELRTATASSSVTGNCFTTSSNPMAFANKWVTSTINANYWQGVGAGNKYQPDPSGNAVNDQNPLSQCPLSSSICSGAPAANLLAQYRFEEAATYNGTAGEVKDMAAYAGGPFNGKVIGTPVPEKLNLLPARTGGTGTCHYLNLPGPNVGGGAVRIDNLPVSTAAGAQTSVSFWMYWKGSGSQMPIGWGRYDLYFGYGGFGFNTANSDVFGVANTGLANGWHHIVAVFTNGDVTKNLLYVDGVAQTLTDQSGGLSTSIPANAYVQSSLSISGWGANSTYRFNGLIDEVKVFNGAVNTSQVRDLYNETHPCTGSGPVAEWRMDELSWNGTAKEVKDSSPYGQHGVAALSAYGTRASTIAGGKICGMGNFTGAYSYVDVGDSSLDRLSGPFTLMGWIRMNGSGNYQYIFSNARDVGVGYRGFELLGQYGSGRPVFRMFFSDGTLGTLSGSATLASGVWAHYTAVWDGSSMQLYLNGVLNAQTSAYAGKSMASPSSFPGTLGAMARNASSNRGSYDLNGYLDEIKAWDRALSAAEVKAIVDNENLGLNWDGTTRECDNQAPLTSWRMDEGFWSSAAGQVKDSINTAASGPHGTAYGNGQTTISGWMCSAGDYKRDSVDGAADYLIMPIPAAGLSNKRFSVSMWVKFNSLGDEMVLMHILNSGTSNSRYFYLSNGQTNPAASHAGLHFGTLNQDGGWGRAYGNDNDVFAIGQWYHLMTVVDAERGRLTAYLNGSVAVDMSIPAGAIPGTPTAIWLGGTPEGSRYLDGNIDEVLLFNGGLTETQAKYIFTQQLAKREWNGSSRSCPSLGIPTNFNCVETAEPSSGGKLYTKVAGQAFSFDVVALKADGSVQTLYATEADRTVKVELIDGSQTTACAGRSSVQTLPNLIFLRTGVPTEKGRKTYTVADGVVNNANKNLRCRITDTATTGTAIYGCSTDNFAIRPQSVSIATAASAPTTTPMNATSPVIKAGANFTLSASSATANYTDNLSLDTAKLTAQAPTSSSKLAGGILGTLSPVTLKTNNGNVNATYSEVGYLFLAPGAFRDDQFTAVDQPNECISSQSSTDYLSDVAIGGKVGCTVGNKTEVTMGRFIPYQFSIVPQTFVMRSALSCSPASGFNYYDEDFSSNFMLTAHNQSGAITQNYTSLFARLNPLLWSSFGFVATGQPAGALLAPGSGTPSGVFASGQATVMQSLKLGVASPPAAPATVSITALPVDADGVSLPGATAASIGSGTFRQGRARLMNAQGSELLDLPVTFRIENWLGQASGWSVNADDNCSPATVTLADGKNLTGSSLYAASQTCVLKSSGACLTTRTGRSFSSPAAAGKFNLWLKAPGAGRSGFVTVNVDVPSYLEFDWSGSKADPAARATFGLRKSSPVLFRREVFGR